MIIPLFIWFVARVLLILLAPILTGKMYYQFPGLVPVLYELSVMFLCLIIPLTYLLSKTDRSQSLLQSLAIKFTGWKDILWAAAGFISIVALMLGVNALFGSPFSYSYTQPADRVGSLLFIILLVALTPVAEEILFRGYLQTTFTRRYGAVPALFITAVLFGISHLPSDLYFGTSAPVGMWASRSAQLYGSAIIFSFVRMKSGSIIPTWFIHEGIILLIFIQ